MNQKILAIDPGTYSLKALLLERRYEGFEILDFAEHVLNLQARLSHEEQLGLALEHLSADPKWHDADVVITALPGSRMSCRVLELPFTNTKRIQEILDFELESYIPMPIEEVFSDFHVLGQTGDTAQVLTVYLPQTKVAGYMDVFAAKGFDPKYFGSDLIDLASLAQVAMVPKSGFYILCDIGHSKTNICIMEGSKLCYARTLGVAGAQFTRAIQRAYNLNFEKAESLKVSRGRIYVREEESDQISRILTHVALELITLIKQTVMAFQNQMGQAPIAAIYCCGGSSQLIGLLDYLSFHLKTNVMELNPLHLVAHSFKDTDEVSLKMAPALSLALRPIFSGRIPKINFRKGNFAFKQDILAVTSELKSVFVFLFLVIAASVGYYFYADHFFDKKMASVDQQVKKWVKDADLEVDAGTTRKAEKGGNVVKIYLKSAQAKLDELHKQVGDFSGVSSLTALGAMQEIAQILPPKGEVNFQIAEFNFSDGFLKLTAETDDPLNVQKIIAALQKSAHFTSIEADDPKAKPGNIWDFSIKMDLQKSADDDSRPPAKPESALRPAGPDFADAKKDV